MNKLNINSTQLKNAVAKLIGIVSKKGTRPILSNSLFKFSGNQLEIFSTDLDISSKVILDCNTHGDSGEFCLNTKNIFDILRELPDLELKFEIDQDNKLIKLNAKNIKYSLLMIPSKDYPEISFEHNEENTITLESDDLKEIILKTSFAMSTDETRMFLNGIYLQNYEGQLRAVAIDGHRLAMLDRNLKLESNELVDGVIIPRKGVNELRRMAEINADKKIKLSFSKAFLMATLENEYYISIRLISREYPKYSSVIPNKSKSSVTLNRDELISAIKRVKILSNETTNGIKLFFKENLIELKANNEVYGEGQEQIESNYKGDEISMSLNASYLLDTLSVIDNDSIIFEMNNSRSPLVIKPSNDSNFLGIVMPLRI